MTDWQPGTPNVDPDAVDALALRLGHVPLQIVAHHPRVVRRNRKLVERSHIYTRIGFAESDLAFDENQVEEAGQPKSVDLVPLQVRTAIGEQRQTAATRPQPRHRLDRILDWPQPVVPQVVIRVANPLRQRDIVQANLFQRNMGDLPPRGRQVEATDAVALGIRPIPLSHALDRVVDEDGIARRHLGAVRAAGVQPAGGDPAAVVEDGVVEIEKNGSRKSAQED